MARDDFEDLRAGGRDPRPGDIVYSRNASVGVAAYIHGEIDVCMGQDVVLISRRPRDCELLAYVLNYAVEDQVERMSVGSTFSRINVPVIRSLIVPHDGAEREASALATIKARFVPLQLLETELRELVGTLTAYRDALIVEAVTGQLDPMRLTESAMEEGLAAVVEGARPEVPA